MVTSTGLLVVLRSNWERGVSYMVRFLGQLNRTYDGTHNTRELEDLGELLSRTEDILRAIPACRVGIKLRKSLRVRNPSIPDNLRSRSLHRTKRKQRNESSKLRDNHRDEQILPKIQSTAGDADGQGNPTKRPWANGGFRVFYILLDHTPIANHPIPNSSNSPAASPLPPQVNR